MTAAPATSPFGLKRLMPSTEAKETWERSKSAKPVRMGIGDVTWTLIWAMPPGGAISSGMRTVGGAWPKAANAVGITNNEQCRVFIYLAMLYFQLAVIGLAGRERHVKGL